MSERTFDLRLERVEVAAVTAAVSMFKRSFVEAARNGIFADGDEVIHDEMLMTLERVNSKLMLLVAEATESFMLDFDDPESINIIEKLTQTISDASMLSDEE